MNHRFKPIVTKLQNAGKHVQYPKVKLQNGDLPLKLSLAGSGAKMPNSVNVSNGKPFHDPDNQWYGRILPNGMLNLTRGLSSTIADKITDQLQAYMDNPMQYAKIYAEATGQCMYCCKKLTDPQSIAVGYGPICAETYGLPHGGLSLDPTQFEVEFAEAELELEESMTQLAFTILRVRNAIENLHENVIEAEQELAVKNLEAAYNTLKSLGDS